MEVTTQLVVKQIQALEGLIQRTRPVHDGDRSYLLLKGTATFKYNDFSTKELVFNVPKESDFLASRLNFFLSSRIVSVTDPTTFSELTYRPTDFDFNVELPSAAANKERAGFVFELRDSVHGDWQNAPVALPLVFSGRPAWMPYDFGDALIPVGEYPSSMVLHAPGKLAKGSTMTARITPQATFSELDGADQIREFRIVGVLRGHKIVPPGVGAGMSTVGVVVGGLGMGA